MIIVLAFISILSFVVFSVNAAETQLIYDVDSEGINVKIYTPYQAYPDDTMTIRIRVEAREELQDVTVTIRLYGSQAKGYTTWLRSLDALKNRDLSLGTVEDQYFNVSIPENVDPGLLHALITCSWEVWRESSWQEWSIDNWFAHRVTYLRNKPYEDLQTTYSQLLADYNALVNSYNTLQANYNQLLAGYDSLQTSYNNLQANYSTLENNHTTLQTNYDSLNSAYTSLLSDHSSLQASYNELKSKYEFAGDMANALDLMYVFIETTVIFIATTIYFVLRKRKPKPKKTNLTLHKSETKHT